MKTWKIIKLGIKPQDDISLICPHCGTDASMPISKIDSPVIASIGLGLIFDNPSYIPQEQILPSIIQCRYCKRIYEWVKDDKNGQKLG